jgi:hypothetical protein
MTVVHFALDTLKVVETLIVAGMPEKQARALSEIQKDMLENNMATKIDIMEIKQEITGTKAELKYGIAEVKADVKLLKWMIGFVLAGIATVILKVIF